MSDPALQDVQQWHGCGVPASGGAEHGVFDSVRLVPSVSAAGNQCCSPFWPCGQSHAALHITGVSVNTVPYDKRKTKHGPSYYKCNCPCSNISHFTSMFLSIVMFCIKLKIY